MKPISAWAGMIGSILFVVVFMIEGWLRPDYSVSQMEISALSRGSRGWIQILNFIVSGMLFLVFASGIAHRYRNMHKPRLGPVLIFVTGLCLILSGFFVMDAPNTPRSAWTLHG